MLALLTLLQFADIYTTHRILKRGGRELNPVLAKLFTIADPVFVMVTLKSLMITLLFIYPVPQVLMFLFIVFYVWIVLNNYKELKKMQSIH